MPEWDKEVRKRLAGLSMAPEREAEITQELAQHLEDRYQELMTGGVTEARARQTALEELRGYQYLARELKRVEQPVTREPVVLENKERTSVLGDTWRDLRYGLRMLAKSPGFTLVVVLTLALGIGANSAIFSVINAVLIRPLAYPDPDRLVQLWETEAAPGQYNFAGPDYLDWQAQNQTFAGTSLFTWPQGFNASGEGEPEQASVRKTQANFFTVLGVEPLLGRAFRKGEDQAGQDRVAVLSYGFWQRHFGGRRDAVGKSLELNGEEYTVVGVMPAWFREVGSADLWVPMDMTPKNLGQRGNHSYLAIARLKSGVPLAKARADVEIIAKHLEKQYPDSNHKVGAVVIPLKEELIGDSRAQLLIMLGAVGLVMLIACANVATLLLVRATGRQREIAVRRALGAGRGRVVRQLLTESMLLSLIGGIFGLALAWACVRGLAGAEAVPIPRPNPITVDGVVLLFTLAVSFIVGIMFGLAPALQVSHLHLNEELKAGGQAVLTPSGRRRTLRDALIVAEIAVSLVVLTGGGLLLRSFAKMRQVQIGADPEGVLTTRLVLPEKTYSTLDQAGAFCLQLVEDLKSAPGVRAVALSSEIPLEGGSNGYVTVPGQENAAFENTLVEWNNVTPDYFRAFGIPFLRGRNFSAQDFKDALDIRRKFEAMRQSGKMEAPENSRLEAVINQTMARTFWPKENPLGKIFKVGGSVSVTVIGMVGDTKQWGIRQPVIPQVYFPLAAKAGDPVTIVVKGGGDPHNLLAAVRGQVHSLDTTVALYHVRSMEEIISESMGDTRYETLLLGFFALLALTLTAVGIYGVTAYAVTQRTHEIGIRMALGAERCEVLRLMISQGARLALCGVALGFLGAFMMTRLMASLLFGVNARDPLTFALAAASLMIVAVLACYLPARRATKLDPMVALRYE
jgi:putative ABC transport system permease protein